MKKLRTPAAGREPVPRRRYRSHPTPKWLKQSPELDAIARRRCLMILSVLSGEMPVSEAIVEAKISRATYYQLEDRALKAMLAVLNPLAPATDSGTAQWSAADQKITQLEALVQHLTRDKRRTQRLLLLTRKTLKAPLTLAHRGRPRLTPGGPKHLRPSMAKAVASPASIPTPDGVSRP